VFCWNSCLHVFCKKRSVFRISGNDVFFSYSFLFFHDLFYCPFPDLAGNKFAVKLAPRHSSSPTQKQATPHSSPHDTTLPLVHTQTSDLPQFTPRHYTPSSPPTTHYLLIPAPTSRTLHPTKTPSTQSERNFCLIAFPKYSSQSNQHGSRLVWVPSLNPEPWLFTNNSLGLPRAQSLSVCLFFWAYVVCVYFLLYLSVYLCFARCAFSTLFHMYWIFFQFQNIDIFECRCKHDIVYMTLFVPPTSSKNPFIAVSTPMTYM